MGRRNRRKFRRTPLRLRIARLEGLGVQRIPQELWTTNVSAGGMFFHAPLPHVPARGTVLSFEMNVPPGEGYSASEGRIRGSGTVIRTVPVAGQSVGVALQFTRPLTLEF